MSRGKKKASHRHAPPPPPSHKFCTYCQVHKVACTFSKHQKACKRIWQMDHEARGMNRTMGNNLNDKRNETPNEMITTGADALLENENLLMDIDDSPLDDYGTEQSLLEGCKYGPHLPEAFLKIIPHPKSVNQASLIIPLIRNFPARDSTAPYIPQPEGQPWAPFHTLEDFEVTEIAIASLMPRKVINKFLAGVTGKWSDGKSPVTLKKYSDMDVVLLKAQKYVVQFKHEEVFAEFNGKIYNFKFQYRDPWDYISSLVGIFQEQIFDEPNTAETWWNVDSELPESDPYPHCYVPLHFWLDKGMVTRHVKKYPMVIPAAWLPWNIRNASGNGSGLLLGYMPIVLDPGDPDERNTKESLEFTHFKQVVYHKVLHDVTGNFKPRTSESMRSVIGRASQALTKTEKEIFLQAFGLHDIQHFLWDFCFSDPYAASCYDTLHSDDLGKWGKHMWELLLNVLEKSGKKGELTRNMALFPCWSNLKHFHNVSTTTFGDGQAFYDILKCILPCIIQLLPRNSIFVKCIRTYQRYRLMIGLNCMSERRLQRLSEIIGRYKDEFLKLCNVYDKNPNFPKQHAVDHIIAEIRTKGTTDNYGTRVGEGFQQESSQAYDQTNGKNAEDQASLFQA
ncbi:hypothetical protein BYT27DRAFT_7262875 [Phlegmacium glaucopus]|nr:hypothetical protein BYT27DRAFT_7262875 [Phlegmacium glaucopus]